MANPSRPPEPPVEYLGGEVYWKMTGREAKSDGRSGLARYHMIREWFDQNTYPPVQYLDEDSETEGMA